MSLHYNIEYTDTYGGDANYSWVRRSRIIMPELTHYGFDGQQGYSKANRIFERELMRKAKASMGLTGRRGATTRYGDLIEFRPYGSATILFVAFDDVEA